MATQTKRKPRTKSSGGRSIPPRKKTINKSEAAFDWEMRMSDACDLTKKQRALFIKFYTDNFDDVRVPEAVLIREAKKQKNKAIHDLFLNWDIQVAATKCWETRASYLMRNINWVKVNIKTQEVVGTPVKAWVNVAINSDRSIPAKYYVSSTKVYKKEDIDFIMRKCRREFYQVRDRFQQYANFFDVFEPVLKALDSLTLPGDEE